MHAEGPLVDLRTRQLLAGLAQSLERRGIDADTYFRAVGQNPTEVAARLQQEAARSVARNVGAPLPALGVIASP